MYGKRRSIRFSKITAEWVWPACAERFNTGKLKVVATYHFDYQCTTVYNKLSSLYTHVYTYLNSLHKLKATSGSQQ